MLRALFRIFSTKSGKTSSLDGESSASNDAVVLYALPQQSGSGGGPAKLPELPSERVNHRARLMAMQLAHTRLCSEKRCQRLRELGLVTAGDLASADLRAISRHFSAPGKANRVLKSYAD